MLAAMGIHLLQWVLAHLAMDALFRVIPLEPEGLEAEFRRYRRRYRWLAAGCVAGGGAVQVALAGGWAIVPALLGWLPWWLLWRFGWRKQFPFLQ